MAAIDKLYIHSYYDFYQLRRWALVYYPELIFYIYGFFRTYKQYDEDREDWVKAVRHFAKRDYERFGKYENEEEAIYNLIAHYKETADYDCTYEQARDEFLYSKKKYNMTDEELEDEYAFAAMNTPLSVDRKLKWICPVPCVREYLHKQCGVNPKWEWLYKIFWRGKKHFLTV